MWVPESERPGVGSPAPPFTNWESGLAFLSTSFLISKVGILTALVSWGRHVDDME